MDVQLSSLSPRSYYREVANLEHAVENFKNQTQRLIDTFKQFTNTGSCWISFQKFNFYNNINIKLLVRDGVFLSDTVLEFGSSQNLGSRECEVLTIGETVKFIESSRRHLLESVQVIFVTPLEEFLRNDINEVHTMKQKLTESKEEYSQAKLRFDVARSSGKSTTKFNKELEEAKKAYKVAEITYSNKLVDIMARKEFEVVEKLCTYMFAQANYFHEGFEALSKLEPTMRQMMNTLVITQNDYLESKNRLNIDEMINKKEGIASKYDAKVKQGFIFVKKKSSWIRRWLVVSGGFLFIYKGWKELEPISKINLISCTVKVLQTERNHCLSFTSPSGEPPLIFQSMGPDDMIEWKSIIESGISLQLSLKKPSHDKFAYLGDLRNIDKSNAFCADCNAECPEWGITNLGMIICNECADIHKGIDYDHKCKVRSLQSEHWNDELFHILKVCGNEKGNRIYEHSLNPSDKPNPSSDFARKEEFIRVKYVERRYVERPVVSSQQLKIDLLDRCNEGDIYSVMKLIAQGVDVNYSINPDIKQTLIHQIMIHGKASTHILELIIQNGAQVCAMETTGKTPLHYAAEFDRVTYARILVLRGASENSEDNDQQTPLSISSSIQNSKVFKYFNKEISDEDLAGVQPADMESLLLIKTNFVDGIDLIRTKLDLVRQQLKVAETIEESTEIMKKVRAIKLAISFD